MTALQGAHDEEIEASPFELAATQEPGNVRFHAGTPADSEDEQHPAHFNLSAWLSSKSSSSNSGDGSRSWGPPRMHSLQLGAGLARLREEHQSRAAAESKARAAEAQVHVLQRQLDALHIAAAQSEMRARQLEVMLSAWASEGPAKDQLYEQLKHSFFRLQRKYARSQAALGNSQQEVNIIRATNLPSGDWWNGLSDPYVVVAITPASSAANGAQKLTYKTRTAWKDLNPHYDEFFEVGNLPEGSQLLAEVWDKDVVTPDDVLGSASWMFAPQQAQQQQQQDWHHQWQQPPQHANKLPPAVCGRVAVTLQLRNPGRGNKLQGQLELEVQYRPSQQAGPPLMLGPVRFRQHLSPTAGWLMGNMNDDRSMEYSTYKLYLLHIGSIFEGVRHPWNRQYPNAAALFGNPVMLIGVRSQHASLYATQLGQCRMGVLRDETDFFALFNFGKRGNSCRYFTYSLLADSLRCSETGAKFSQDMMSKHAMHAAGAEEVLYAGEFCIVEDLSATGGHRLVIDNNSGTYAPKAEHLPRMARLFAANFPHIKVETLTNDDPRLKAYHQQCPSRTSATPGWLEGGRG
ncbi:hypothetical protein N2152v2_001314 [Parachlorella kessleri]